MSMIPIWRRFPPPGSWIEHAACRHTDHAEQFDAPGSDCRETTQQRHQRVRSALAYCRKCPVAGECLSYAMTYRLTGVWGGRYLDTKHARPQHELPTGSASGGCL